MTFGVSRDHGKFEWAGTSLGTLFAQKSSVLDPGMWRMIFDIIRFNQFALDLLLTDDSESSVPAELTIGEYLWREGYSARFRDDYLIPMTACIWSTGPEKCTLEFPAITLVRFLWNHHLLNTIAPRAPWMTLSTFGRSYVNAILKDFPKDRFHLSTAIEKVYNLPDGKVLLEVKSGKSQEFDAVLLACHGDESYKMVSATATSEEHAILKNFKTSENIAYLHSDLSVFINHSTHNASLLIYHSLCPNERLRGARGTISHIPPMKPSYIRRAMKPMRRLYYLEAKLVK